MLFRHRHLSRLHHLRSPRIPVDAVAQALSFTASTVADRSPRVCRRPSHHHLHHRPQSWSTASRICFKIALRLSLFPSSAALPFFHHLSDRHPQFHHPHPQHRHRRPPQEAAVEVEVEDGVEELPPEGGAEVAEPLPLPDPRSRPRAVVEVAGGPAVVEEDEQPPHQHIGVRREQTKRA